MCVCLWNKCQMGAIQRLSESTVALNNRSSDCNGFARLGANLKLRDFVDLTCAVAGSITDWGRFPNCMGRFSFSKKNGLNYFPGTKIIFYIWRKFNIKHQSNSILSNGILKFMLMQKYMIIANRVCPGH